VTVAELVVHGRLACTVLLCCLSLQLGHVIHAESTWRAAQETPAEPMTPDPKRITRQGSQHRTVNAASGPDAAEVAPAGETRSM